MHSRALRESGFSALSAGRLLTAPAPLHHVTQWRRSRELLQQLWFPDGCPGFSSLHSEFFQVCSQPCCPHEDTTANHCSLRTCRGPVLAQVSLGMSSSHASACLIPQVQLISPCSLLRVSTTSHLSQRPSRTDPSCCLCNSLGNQPWA